MFDLLPEDLLLKSEDKVLQRTGYHVVGAEKLIDCIDKLVIVLE